MSYIINTIGVYWEEYYWKVKIAQIANIAERVPPKKYGGTERVVYSLTEELVRRGHEVTLFATGDSVTSAKLSYVYPRGLREARLKDPYGSNIWTNMHLGVAYSRSQEFDILHDHTGCFGAPMANICEKPTVMTYHGPFTPEVKRLFSVLNRALFITISHSQASAIVDLPNHMGTVYNGLEMQDYSFSSAHDGYLLFVGRISMEKGVHHAIEVAQYLDKELIIAAKLDSVDMSYFQEYVGPRLSDQIRWVGEIDEEERNRLMSRAMAFLHPVTWPEPFGLTMIEAMACGCPVIAFNHGSIPEIVLNGQTGFVVDNTDQMATAILNIEKIDRVFCRKYALDYFNAQRMADGYEKLYYEIFRRGQEGYKQNAMKTKYPKLHN